MRTRGPPSGHDGPVTEHRPDDHGPATVTVGDAGTRLSVALAGFAGTVTELLEHLVTASIHGALVGFDFRKLPGGVKTTGRVNKQKAQKQDK